MGFGILFLGYFVTTMMPIPLALMLPESLDLGGVVRLLGYIIIIIASKKLFEYDITFKSLVVSSSLMAGISGIEAIVAIFDFLTFNQIIANPFSGALSTAKSIVEYVSFALVIIFISTLCLSIKSIARETGVKKIEIAATRNFVFYCILLVVQAIAFIPFKLRPYFALAVTIIEVICWLFNLYMLFSCYAKICDSSDVEMKQKPSRFSFINQKREERESERQEIIDEALSVKTETKKKKKKKK